MRAENLIEQVREVEVKIKNEAEPTAEILTEISEHSSFKNVLTDGGGRPSFSM